MTVLRIDPPGMRFAGMSQGVRCGDLLLISGQVALRDGQVVGGDDAAAQAEQCFANIEAVLAAGGGALANVVSLRCYLTRRDAYGGYAAAKNARFGSAPSGSAPPGTAPPCSTVVIVAGLLMPDLLMEVEAVAWLGDGNTDAAAGDPVPPWGD